MGKKVLVDLTGFAVNPSESTIRQIFFKDQDLRFIFFLINNHEPITIPDLKNKFNQMFGTSHDRPWFYHKLGKIDSFNLYSRKTYVQCRETSTDPIDKEIIHKHREWLLDKQEQFYKRWESNQYLFLTDEGNKWIPELQKIQQRLKSF